ncbi:hypothetical protein Clopa_4666 [Clostridium pasteurianum BC1]|uniref:Uncharacterized protein n=1 Tax=Clostridium pasteurianum BC1 TaxID=86416 RepID=R4KIB1_CLOPA|nr:hypothetical protein Clopa_4666 [Clostridium pasteurianum BC1]
MNKLVSGVINKIYGFYFSWGFYFSAGYYYCTKKFHIFSHNEFNRLVAV